MNSIRERFDHVDDPDVLVKAKTDLALAMALSLGRPRNWHGSGLTPDRVLPIASESGIPVVWVPPTEVLIKLAEARPDERMDVLASHEQEVLDDCEWHLAQCTDIELRDTQRLAQLALRAFRDGHYQAAMTLAVAVAEGPAVWASKLRMPWLGTPEESARHENMLRTTNRYTVARLQLTVLDSKERQSQASIPWRALISPIPRFFTPFHPDEDDQIPETVSRHVTVHLPSIAHLSRDNALVSIMLCTSLAREQQDYLNDVRD